jgi:hypothetical protein
VLPASAAAQLQTPPNQSQQKQQQHNQQTVSTVKLGALEEHPAQYIGQKITVSGEVGEVLGPRLFTIDERHWIDFDGETLVMVLAALVRDNNPVTVTGTVRRFVRAEIEPEWGWFDEPGVDIDFADRAVIMADRVTSAGEELAIRMNVNRDTAVGTSGSATTGRAGQPITDAQMLASSNDERLVGRRVELHNARVSSMASGNGFWISGTGNERVFVLPSEKMQVQIGQGQTVDITGVVLQLPNGMRERIGDRSRDEDIYVYGNQVEQTKAQQKQGRQK